MSRIADTLELGQVMSRLAKVRSVFHSEADFQHAFGQVLHDLAPTLRVRMEVPRTATSHGRTEYLDLMCSGPSGRTAIEFKYWTASWNDTDPLTGERFRLRSHAATDLARLYFVSDIERLERLCSETEGTNGLAIMLSNDQLLWSEPGTRITRDGAFRIHEGQPLAGKLVWGAGDCAANNRNLSGEYTMTWNPYGKLRGIRGEFRWLGVEVHASTSRGSDHGDAG